MTKEIIAYLEELQDLRKPAHLRFMAENGGIVSINAIITELQAGGTEWSLVANNTLRIPLGRLLNVNEMPVQLLA